jgi:hypothetical protein
MTPNFSGVSDFSVNLETQEVLVTGSIPYDDLLAKLKKTGKEVRLSAFRSAFMSLFYLLGSLWGDLDLITRTPLCWIVCGFVNSVCS